MSSSRPRGRRPGSSGTREAILAAARERFAEVGYDRTRIRDVAGDAGVDAALVHYFFKSKDGLFVAAMELPFRPAEVIAPVLAEGVDGLGERMARRMLTVWDENTPALLALVNSASSHPGAALALREFVLSEIVGRLSSTLGRRAAGRARGLAGGGADRRPLHRARGAAGQHGPRGDRAAGGPGAAALHGLVGFRGS